MVVEDDDGGPKEKWNATEWSHAHVTAGSGSPWNSSLLGLVFTFAKSKTKQNKNPNA
jgi:hypothetical protein